MNEVKNSKKPVEIEIPGDYKLIAVSTYAKDEGITSARAYQRFQEGKIEIVSLDGIQFVKLDK